MKEPVILYEDNEVLVVDKPAGIVVYPDGIHDYPALSSWLDGRYGEGNYFFAHRIDRETSGVLIVAKNAEAHEMLKEQFQNREVRKVYRAFVHGPIKGERGVIDKPIGNSRGGRGPRSVKKPHGELRDALTAYRVIKSSTSFDKTQDTLLGTGTSAVTYVEVFPKTGRTHQIRVHFASIQHPLISDQLYAPTRPKLLGFNRLALHALSLTLRLPSGQEKTFTAPLPADFVAAEGELRNH